MVNNPPPDHVENSAYLPEALKTERHRLSYRGRWILLAVLFSILAWALVAYLGVKLLAP